MSKIANMHTSNDSLSGNPAEQNGTQDSRVMEFTLHNCQIPYTVQKHIFSTHCTQHCTTPKPDMHIRVKWFMREKKIGH